MSDSINASNFVLKLSSMNTVGVIMILSLADFVGLPTYKEWNCV